MLYSCPNKASVDVIRELNSLYRATTLAPIQATPEESLIASAMTNIEFGERDDLVRAAALLIVAIELRDEKARAPMNPEVADANLA